MEASNGSSAQAQGPPVVRMGMPASMGTQPGQSPQMATGATPASTPSPNRGLEAAALAKLAVHTQALQQLLMAFPVGSDAAKEIRDAVGKLAKLVPSGSVSQGVMMSEAQKALFQQRQQQPQIAAMRAAQTGGAAPSPQPAQPQMAA